MGFEDEKLFIFQMVNLDLFKKLKNHSTHNVQYILQRLIIGRGQYLFQGIDSLWFAWPTLILDLISTRWLQEWSKDKLYNELTDYGNLVLLSDGEAHPLVCLEAFAGLGVVVSEWAASNLDVSKDFITVILRTRSQIWYF